MPFLERSAGIAWGSFDLNLNATLLTPDLRVGLQSVGAGLGAIGAGLDSIGQGLIQVGLGVEDAGEALSFGLDRLGQGINQGMTALADSIHQFSPTGGNGLTTGALQDLQQRLARLQAIWHYLETLGHPLTIDHFELRFHLDSDGLDTVEAIAALVVNGSCRIFSVELSAQSSGDANPYWNQTISLPPPSKGDPFSLPFVQWLFAQPTSAPASNARLATCTASAHLFRISGQYEHYIGGATFEIPPYSTSVIPGVRVFPTTLAFADKASPKLDKDGKENDSRPWKGARLVWITDEFTPYDKEQDDKGKDIKKPEPADPMPFTMTITGGDTSEFSLADPTGADKPTTTATQKLVFDDAASFSVFLPRADDSANRDEISITPDPASPAMYTLSPGVRLLAYNPALDQDGGLSVADITDPDPQKHFALDPATWLAFWEPKQLSPAKDGLDLAAQVYIWRVLFQDVLAPQTKGGSGWWSVLQKLFGYLLDSSNPLTEILNKIRTLASQALDSGEQMLVRLRALEEAGVTRAAPKATVSAAWTTASNRVIEITKANLRVEPELVVAMDVPNATLPDKSVDAIARLELSVDPGEGGAPVEVQVAQAFLTEVRILASRRIRGAEVVFEGPIKEFGNVQAPPLKKRGKHRPEDGEYRDDPNSTPPIGR
jgi:hypothetical protein